MVLIYLELNPFHTSMLCAEFHWNWPSNSGFLKLSQCILVIWLSSTLGKGFGPSFEQNYILFIPAPYLRWLFVPGLGDITLVALEKQIFKFRYCVFAIWLLSPLEKERGISFEPTMKQTDLLTSCFAIYQPVPRNVWRNVTWIHYDAL